MGDNLVPNGLSMVCRVLSIGGALHGERLVRAFGVELLKEVVEPGLLLEAV